jgi:hypothetical protein
MVFSGEQTKPMATSAGWKPGDLEAIRRALLIPAVPPAIRAIQGAMELLEQSYPGAIATAQEELQTLAVIDQQLEALTIEQLQSPIEITRIGAAAGVLTPGQPPPIAKADVIEYATDLLKEEITTRYDASTPPAVAMRQQRLQHAQALVLMLPALGSWSRDPQLQGTTAGVPYSAPMQRC